MIEILIDEVRRRRRYFDRALDYAREIGRIASELLGDEGVEVYLFGSFAEGRHTPSSDIDILVVSEKAPRTAGGRAEIIGAILRRIGLDSPFEIHLIGPDELNWYERFIGRKIRVR